MRAAVIKSPIGPDGIEIKEVKNPEPGPHEVVVEVAATALNRVDLLQSRGLYGGDIKQPEIPGVEFSGIVDEVGYEVRRVKKGDRVAGLVKGEAFAEKVVAHEGLLMPLPATVDLLTAAAMPEVYITAWDALVLQGGMKEGSRVLVHAGGSGVGTASIQLARALGAKIAVTCSTSKVDDVRALGPDLVIDYRTQEFDSAIATWTGDQGVDLVLDTVGADYVNRNLRVIKPQGTIVMIGLLGGSKAQVDLQQLLRKRAHMVGSMLRPRRLDEKVDLVQRFIKDLMPAVEDGRLSPVVHKTYSLTQIPEALRYMASNRHVGKLLVRVQE